MRGFGELSYLSTDDPGQTFGPKMQAKNITKQFYFPGFWKDLR